MITAKVHGMPELRMALKAMQAQAKAALLASSLAASQPIHDEAERIAPRGFDRRGIGHLADHIEVDVVKSAASVCIIRIGPDQDHWYGRFPETGTRKMSARPYLRPALDTQQKEALRLFSAEMRRRLKAKGGLGTLTT